MKHTIDNLRETLFDTLKDLRDPAKPLDLDRAKAVVSVSKVIIDSAKTEVAFLKATGGVMGTGFIPEQITDGTTKAPGRTVHRIK